jgi:hypothetical protein
MPSAVMPATTTRAPDVDDRRRARASPVADLPSAVAVSATATTIPRSLEYTRRCVFLFILADAARVHSLLIGREVTEAPENDCQKLPSRLLETTNFEIQTHLIDMHSERFS